LKGYSIKPSRRKRAPSSRAPRAALHLSDPDRLAVDTILEVNVVRALIPQLKDAGAQRSAKRRAAARASRSLSRA